MSSSNDPIQPARSNTGATGYSQKFKLKPRVKSFAYSSGPKRRKLKRVSISSYDIEGPDKFEQVADWLVKRFIVSKAELNLENIRDYFWFSIPEGDKITQKDKDHFETMRGEAAGGA